MISPVLLVCSLLWVTLACVIAPAFLAVHFGSSVGSNERLQYHRQMKPKEGQERRLTLARDIGTALRKRYSLFWRRKVRLLLVTGDEAAIEQLVPACDSSAGWRASVPF
nr:Uncharacterised protein [Klebsiella pneumoniae]